MPKMSCLRRQTKGNRRLPKWDKSVIRFSDLDKYGDEPSSPQVGCLGQIKHDKKVVGFPIHKRCNNHKSNGDKKYFSKLNNVFSGKNLNSSSSSSISKYRKRKMMKGERDYYVSNSFISLDPPLPVFRPSPRVSADGSDATSLWRRRGGGEDLKPLQH